MYCIRVSLLSFVILKAALLNRDTVRNRREEDDDKS